MVLLLELGRGLAALWVFLFHIQDFFADSYPVIQQFSNYGHLGVPMFFVISGYVITYSAEANLRSNRSPVFFLKSRFLRIYPTFWASLAAILIIPYIVEAISSIKTGQYIQPENLLEKFSLWEWSNFLLLTKVFFAPTDNLQAEFSPVNAVYWTLAIEFQFYLVVFLCLCLGRFFRRAIALLSIAAILLKFFPTNLNYGLFIHYWPSFSVGIALAYLHRNSIEFSFDSRTRAAVLVCFVLITLYTLLNVSPIRLHTSPLLFAVGFGISLWFYSPLEGVLRSMKNGRNRVLYWLLEPWLIIGAMSYSLYLLHVKLYLIPLMFVRQLTTTNSIFFSLLTIIGTLFLCYPFYYLVERRFLSKNLKNIHQQVITAPAAPGVSGAGSRNTGLR